MSFTALLGASSPPQLEERILSAMVLTELVARVVRLVSLPYLYVSERLIMATSRYRTVHGIEVGILEWEGREHIWQRIEAALLLVKSIDRRWHKRIVSDIRRVLVLYWGGTGFSLVSRNCILDGSFVERYEAPIIASALVHEAVHARLDKMWESSSRSRRIEAICARQELAFLLSLSSEQRKAAEKYIMFKRQVLRKA
jgi:hypothetical protein